jgi:hypothetical protein
VALRNDRLIAIEDDHVVFWYKDYCDQGREKIARVPALEFIDRFLLHILPRSFRHIRNYGFLAQNKRGVKLPLIRRLLGMPEGGLAPEEDNALLEEAEGEDKDKDKMTAGKPCPVCKRGTIIVLTWARPTIAEIMQMPLEQLQQLSLPFQ